ncbi:MAG TPA: ABC transporter permease [Trebonia sp.]|jgi:peptide/nickel transport system permease protein
MSAISPPIGVTRPARSAYLRGFARTVPPGIWLAGIVVVLLLLAGIAPGLFETQNPYAVSLSQAYQGPSPHHLLGTDNLGRDEFSRMVAGTRLSLLIGFGATAIGVVAATVLGILAGLGGKFADLVVSRFLEVLFGYPVLFLALLVVSVSGANLTTEILAVGIGTTAGYARMLRGQILSVRNAGYIEAARAVGHPYRKIIWQHILPNAVRPLVALFTLGVGSAVIWASGLSFLGLGVPPPSPEWGALLDAGKEYITTAWWLEIAPGAAVVLLALSVTVLGRHLQDRLEGRIRTQV